MFSFRLPAGPFDRALRPFRAKAATRSAAEHLKNKRSNAAQRPPATGSPRAVAVTDSPRAAASTSGFLPSSPLRSRFIASGISAAVLLGSAKEASCTARAIAQDAAAVDVEQKESGEAKKADDGSVAGKTVIVTGANTGMGLVIAQELTAKGAHVVMACRSEERGKAALDKVNEALTRLAQSDVTPKGSAELAILDLASLQSVRNFAEDIQSRFPHIDRLINNAGIMIPPHSFTSDGFESQFQVNHLSHYLLTRLLLPKLLACPTQPSIVHVSSLASENISIKPGEFWRVARCQPGEYNAFKAYCQSKLAQVLFTVEMSRRLGDKVTVNAVHPGIVNTELFNRNVPSFVRLAMDALGKVMESVGAVYSSEKGASTAIYLATTPRSVTSSGGYFADSAPRAANPAAFDRAVGREWWEESARACGLDP